MATFGKSFASDEAVRRLGRLMADGCLVVLIYAFNGSAITSCCTKRSIIRPNLGHWSWFRFTASRATNALAWSPFASR
jgi:hypothetical protein